MTSPFDPASFLPLGSQFGSSMTGMLDGFEQRQAGADFKTQMGGAQGFISGGMNLMGDVTNAVSLIQTGKQYQQAGMTAQGRKMKAQAGIDMAAGAAEMAGPIGMGVGMALRGISALLNIQGPRAKRQKRRAEQRARAESKHSAMRANAAAAGLRGAGGMLRTGAHIGPEPTIQNPLAATYSYMPQVVNQS